LKGKKIGFGHFTVEGEGILNPEKAFLKSKNFFCVPRKKRALDS